MVRLSAFLAPAALAGAITLAGCGSSSSNPPRPVAEASATATTPVPAGTPAATPPVVPTPHLPQPVFSGGRYAAIVNGHGAPMSDFKVLFNLSYRRTAGQSGFKVATLTSQVMQEVIEFAIIRQYAASHGITLTPGQINASVKKQVQQNGGQATFQRRLTDLGLTLQTYKSLLEPTLLAQKVIQRVAPISTKPVPVAHVRHILIMFHPQGKPVRSDAATKALALAILRQIQQGASFAALAKKDSEDPGSAVKGGDLGNVYPHEMVPSFDHAVFTLPLHKPTLVRSQYGYHIVEVLSRGTTVRPAQDQQQAQQQAFSAWLSKQVKDAKIKKLARVTIPPK